jgi:hypothetical protein
MQESQPDLQAVSRQFAEWRSRKTSTRCRIPKDLWAEAVRVCGTYPIRDVHKELGLNYDKLKKKVEGSADKPKPSFVSVELPQPQTTDPMCEWIRPDGAKLRVQISIGSLDQLVTSFLGGSR